MSGVHRVQFARPRTQGFKPALTDSINSLAGMRSAESLRVVFFSTRHANPTLRPAAAAAATAVCTVVWHVVTKDDRWWRCCSWSLGPSSRPPTVCCLAAEERGDCVHASRLYPFPNASIATRTSVCTSYCFCGNRLSAQFYFHLVEDLCRFSMWESDRPSRQILAPFLTTWAVIVLDMIPWDFEFVRKPIPGIIFRSKSKNLKLAIGLHKNQPYVDVTMRPYRVDVVPNLPKRPGSSRRPLPVSVLYRYRCQFRYRRPHRYRRCRYWRRSEPTEVSGNGSDIVPNLPKLPVPVWMFYWTCRSDRKRYERLYRYRRYRYPYRTELSKVSGTGISVVPNLPNCPVPVTPALYIGGTPRYVPYRTHLCKI